MLTGLSWVVFLLNLVSSGTSKMAYLMASSRCWLLPRAQLGCVLSTWVLLRVAGASHSMAARF